METKQKHILIAEIACNHQGDFEIAQNLILKAKNCGCQMVKFQKRTPKLQFTEEKYNSPHPNPQNAFGKTYGEHRENLEFSIAQHKELMDFAEKNGIAYSCSVFDIQSAKEVVAINPKHIKIPSPVNNKSDILVYIAQNFSGTLHISLGMTKLEEEQKLISILKKYDRLKNTILYHCVSSYPTRDEDTSLLEINRLKNTYATEIKNIGLSGHHIGYLADCLSVALGAKYIERHFTFDKNAKGSDHKISLDEKDMIELSKNLIKTNLMLKEKRKEILDCELTIREFHKNNN